MNFIELAGLIDPNEGLTLRITKKENVIAVTVLADSIKGKKMQPFSCSGTPEELDAEFIPEFSKATEIVRTFVSNLKQMENDEKLAKKGAKPKDSKANEGTETDDDDDDDDENVQEKPKRVAPPVKLKKVPKKVEALMVKLGNTEDPLMIQHINTEVIKQLKEAKWEDLEIAAYMAKEGKGKIEHPGSVSPQEAFPLKEDSLLGIPATQTANAPVTQNTQAPATQATTTPVTQADIQKMNTSVPSNDLLGIAAQPVSQTQPETVQPMPIQQPIIPEAAAAENLSANLGAEQIQQETVVQQQTNDLLNTGGGGLLF